jgi:L-amino acid N-acyltransferase YncA
MELLFRSMTEGDWTNVAEIYRQGIETGNATFQQSIPDWNEWDKAHLKLCRFVAIKNNFVIGWAALSPVSSRYVYRGVAEVSVYVDNRNKGQKVGTKLLERLVEESEKNNFWTLQAAIFPENIESLKMHKALGFRMVGRRKKIGKMNDRWRDTILMERRSKRAGID